MVIYIYLKDGKIKQVVNHYHWYDVFSEAWDGFLERYDWKEVYSDKETEEDAFDEFCDDVMFDVWEGEFKIVKWELDD